VLVRALLGVVGPTVHLYTAALDGRFQIVLSPAILRELRQVILRPNVRKHFPISLEDLADLLADLQARALLVAGVVEVHGVSVDPKDDMVLACALEAGADYIVTDDRKHLQPIKHWRGTQIVSVPAFLKILRNR
jgi:putative PIN family toxin of toxin-antitoxin system